MARSQINCSTSGSINFTTGCELLNVELKQFVAIPRLPGYIQ